MTLAGRRPSLSQAILCAAVGVGFGIPGFVSVKGLGYLIGTTGYTVFVLPAVLTYTIIIPFIEEPIFRGICFPVLKARSRLLAYAGSTALFTASHTNSLLEFVMHGHIGLTDQHLLILVGFGLVSAYIYESTGKLWLCVISHGVANSMRFVGIFADYLLD